MDKQIKKWRPAWQKGLREQLMKENPDKPVEIMAVMKELEQVNAHIVEMAKMAEQLGGMVENLKETEKYDRAVIKKKKEQRKRNSPKLYKLEE